MSSALSIELPAAVALFVSDSALENYTASGPNNDIEPNLKQLSNEIIFPDGVSDQTMADCCRSGIWLLHNFLDQSHEISQAIHTPEGSFWHAIMHRLEFDFWNSKYWYRKAGDHVVFRQISENGKWNPEVYVDQCESAQTAGESEKHSVQQVAILEWKALFEHCYNSAGKFSQTK